MSIRVSVGLISLLAASSFTAMVDSSLAEELCVGAIGSSKIGKCKYEFEAYIENRGCRKRGGGHASGAVITLTISAPTHLNGHRVTRTTYANFNDDVFGQGCRSACASATAEYRGRRYSTPIRCNVRSYK